jgi:hypothetical protein
MSYDQKPSNGYKREGFIDHALVLPILETYQKEDIGIRRQEVYPSFKNTKWCFFPHFFRLDRYSDVLYKPHMSKFKKLYDSCEGTFKFLEKKFEGFFIFAAEINIIPPGYSIGKHIDNRYWYLMESKRIHVVLETNDDCYFNILDDCVRFKNLEVFEFNNSILHSVDNKSEKLSRAHLVVDMIPVEDIDVFDQRLQKSKAHIMHWRDSRPVEFQNFEKNVL